MLAAVFFYLLHLHWCCSVVNVRQGMMGGHGKHGSTASITGCLHTMPLLAGVLAAPPQRQLRQAAAEVPGGLR